MARALRNTSFTAALSNGIAVFANRRGYAAAAAAVTVARRTTVEQRPVTVARRTTVEQRPVTVARRTTVEQRPVKGAVGGATEATTSWVPDPITGYYRPANRSVEIDAVELRELLLSHKSRD